MKKDSKKKHERKAILKILHSLDSIQKEISKKKGKNLIINDVRTLDSFDIMMKEEMEKRKNERQCH